MATRIRSTRIKTSDMIAAPPPMDSGDRLTRHEFERRYEAMPEIKKAELIEGVVYIALPVRVSHGKPHGQIMGWLGTYCAATPGVDIAVLREGLETAEHAAFVERLAASGRT